MQPQRCSRRPRLALLSSSCCCRSIGCVNMSLEDQRGDPRRPDALVPRDPTLENYMHHLHRPGLVLRLHQLAHLRRDQHRDLASRVALPAAYAFSRYRFLGDKHLFFWLLTNRMAPPAVFLLPFFQLYSADRPVRHALGGGAGALPVQRAAGGLDPGRLHVRRAARDRRDRLSSTATPSRASSCGSSCR